jgi:pyrroline-5-carboxylate reductase
MDDYRIGFVGGGNMAEALIRGLLQAGVMPAATIVASDVSPTRRSHLAATYGIRATENNRQVAELAPIVVLAVKPQGMRAIVSDLATAPAGRLFISIAAGVNLAQLAQWLGETRPVVRVMPNTPALVLAGMSVLCPNAICEKADVETARKIFSAVGDAVVIEREDLLDAVTGLSGCGPGYVFVILDALIEGAVKLGLPRDLSRRLAVQTVLGSARLAAETGRPPTELRDMVASPGGATLAGLEVLERGNLRATLMAALEAATRRSRELSS